LNVIGFVSVALLLFTLLLPPVQQGVLICIDNLRFEKEVRHVVDAARGAVEARGWDRYWIDSIERGSDPKEQGEHWCVHLERFPPELGGHATVYIAADGRLVGYYGGK
jgi:hypothetical protein